ncbi:MAG: hypothetical protein VCD66_10580 [Alphaproteobacteria bacterium]|jgi:hypothetical protein
MLTLARELWAGRRPLKEAFWWYAVAYGFLLNFVTSLVFFAQLANDTNMVWVALAFAVPIPYNIFAVVAVWRSAGRYPGPEKWADWARISSMVWMLALTLA